VHNGGNEARQAFLSEYAMELAPCRRRVKWWSRLSGERPGPPTKGTDQMTQLVKYEAACRALAACRSVDEVIEIRNQSEAIKAYAKQAKNKNMEADAAEIRIRAERRLGEMLGEQPKATASGSNQHRKVERVLAKPAPLATYEEAGIDKNLAHRARQAAAVPSDQFEEIVKETRDGIENEVAKADRKIEKAQPNASGGYGIGGLNHLRHAFDMSSLAEREAFRKEKWPDVPMKLLGTLELLLANWQASDKLVRDEFMARINLVYGPIHQPRTEAGDGSFGLSDGDHTDRFGRAAPAPGALLKQNGATGKHGRPNR
jgi:hypothetical protein